MSADTGCPFDDADLHAYVDGRLDEARRAAVAEWLDGHPEARRRLADWQRQNDLIEALWGDVAAEPVPPRLRLERLDRGQRWRRIGLATAAALALLMAGAAGGWYSRGIAPAAGDPMLALATSGLEAHRLFIAEKRHPVEVAASEEQHLVSWLSKRLERPLIAPDLGRYGLRLLGGRLLPAKAGRPAAQLMYEDPTGARYTLFVTGGSGSDTSFRILEQDGVSALYWIDHDTAYALIGNAPRERLVEICKDIYAQLESASG